MEKAIKKDACIIGMGYVGLTLAIALARNGCMVHGVENNPERLRNLLEARPDVHERNLSLLYADMLKLGRINVSERIPDLGKSAAYIITVGTPLDAEGHANMQPISAVAEDIASVFRPGDLVILRSTVKVGTTRNVVKPILDKAGISYCLAMCPERTAEGVAIQELESLPQIIGGIDEASSQEAVDFFGFLAIPDTRVSTPEAAELAKLICNTQRDLHYAIANEVALICEELGLNAHEIIEAANRGYKRSNIALPGLVGGPCLEKDAYILAESIQAWQPEITMAGRLLNERLTERAVSQLAEKVRMPVRKAVILGLAFKGMPETGDVRGSLAITLQDSIKRHFPDTNVLGFDPVASLEECDRWGLQGTMDFEEALEDADIVFIQNNHKYFQTKECALDIERICAGKYIYDFWHCVHPALQKSCKVHYMALGQGTVSQRM